MGTGPCCPVDRVLVRAPKYHCWLSCACITKTTISPAPVLPDMGLCFSSLSPRPPLPPPKEKDSRRGPLTPHAGDAAALMLPEMFLVERLQASGLHPGPIKSRPPKGKKRATEEEMKIWEWERLQATRDMAYQEAAEAGTPTSGGAGQRVIVWHTRARSWSAMQLGKCMCGICERRDGGEFGGHDSDDS